MKRNAPPFETHQILVNMDAPFCPVTPGTDELDRNRLALVGIRPDARQIKLVCTDDVYLRAAGLNAKGEHIAPPLHLGPEATRFLVLTGPTPKGKRAVAVHTFPDIERSRMEQRNPPQFVVVKVHQDLAGTLDVLEQPPHVLTDTIPALLLAMAKQTEFPANTKLASFIVDHTDGDRVFLRSGTPAARGGRV